MNTDTKELAAELRRYNAWRRGDESIEGPNPKRLGDTIDEAADRLEELELKNQTFRAAQKACEDCDAPRVDRIAELERELLALYKTADKLEDDKESNARLCESLRADWEAERALADRLADVAINQRGEAEALAAWKEARSE